MPPPAEEDDGDAELVAPAVELELRELVPVRLELAELVPKPVDDRTLLLAPPVLDHDEDGGADEDGAPAEEEEEEGPAPVDDAKPVDDAVEDAVVAPAVELELGELVPIRLELELAELDPIRLEL